MQKIIVSFFLCMLFVNSFAQEFIIKNTRSGIVSLGGRSTISAFNNGSLSNAGLGIGGQFRIQLAERVNTDWFFDYINGNAGSLASRKDYHIGWSVLYYLRNKQTSEQFLQPYILAGHCFDYTFQRENMDHSNFSERWSSAIQAGLGTHINLSPRFDVSLVTQYMMHLGTDIHAEEENGKVNFEKHHGASLEGHLLFHVSINYKIADLW